MFILFDVMQNAPLRFTDNVLDLIISQVLYLQM